MTALATMKYTVITAIPLRILKGVYTKTIVAKYDPVPDSPKLDKLSHSLTPK